MQDKVFGSVGCLGSHPSAAAVQQNYLPLLHIVSLKAETFGVCWQMVPHLLQLLYLDPLKRLTEYVRMDPCGI